MSTNPSHISVPPLRGSVGTAVATVRELVAKTLHTMAFWSAMILPAVYLPVLFTGSLTQYALPFAALLALHAIAIVLGQRHTPRFRRKSTPD